MTEVVLWFWKGTLYGVAASGFMASFLLLALTWAALGALFGFPRSK
jgi:hypothetical protein